MPRLTCWFIRMSLVHLATGATLGGLILSAKGQPELLDWAWRLLPAHIQLLIGGWMIQLTLGMAYWILPRLDTRGERGRSVWAWASFWLLNTGVIGAALLLAVGAFRPDEAVARLEFLAALLQALALAAFTGHAWPRVRPAPLPPVSGSQQSSR